MGVMVQDRDGGSKHRTHPLGGVQTKAKSKPWLSEEERFIDLLTRNGRMTSLQLAALLKMSRRQVMQIAQKASRWVLDRDRRTGTFTKKSLGFDSRI